VERGSYTRRFTLLYVSLISLLIVLVAVFSRIHNNRIQQQRIHEHFLSIQNLLRSAYQEMPEERFIPWLNDASLHTRECLNWNVVWLAPDLSIRWAIHPIVPDELPLQRIEEQHDQNITCNDYGHCPPFRTRTQSSAIHLQRLSDRDPEAGWLLLYTPLSRFFLDAQELWIGALSLLLLLAGAFFLYQYLIRRHVQNLIEESGLSKMITPPKAHETIEGWAKQYAHLASRKIEETRDQFDSLFDILQDGIFLLDSENRILRANTAAAALLGETPETLIGHPLSETTDHIVLERHISKIRATATYQASEIQLSANDALCNVAGIPIREQNRRAPSSHVMLVLRDLTRLRQLERAGEEYAVNVSHELKTPLTMILGYTETLLSHNDMDAESQERFLRTIERHAKRISRIIDDLLRLAWLRNEDYTVGIPRAEAQIGTLINETIFMCDEWARNAGIEIKVDFPEDLTWKLNSGLMEEALINLVKNAILYAIVGPVEIRVRVTDSGNLEFAVIDRGPGLKPEDAQHIFDRFYRSDKGRARAKGGSGLGLPIVQQIIEAHKGTARVETAPGEGCIFILEIPPNSI